MRSGPYRATVRYTQLLKIMTNQVRCLNAVPTLCVECYGSRTGMLLDALSETHGPVSCILVIGSVLCLEQVNVLPFFCCSCSTLTTEQQKNR